MSDLSNAIKQICEEKGLGFDAVIATIESALAAAYRKDYGQKNQNNCHSCFSRHFLSPFYKTN